VIDATNGTHLWADRFDGSLEDVFELQDKVAVSVAAVIEPALQAAEVRRSIERPTIDLTAYDLYLRAYQIYAGSVGKNRLMEASNLLGQAIERDPGYGLALGFAAFIRGALDVAGGIDDPDRNRTEAVGLAQRCLGIAHDDPGALCYAGFAFGYFGEDLDAATSLVDRSLALNPSYAEGWLRSGLLRIYAGNLDLAITHVETSMRLNPRARMALPLAAIGIAYFFDRRFEHAVPKFLAATQQRPSYQTPYRFLAACYAQMGRLAEAREIVDRLRTITPVVVPNASYLRHSEHRELFLSGLRLAAGEAT
jgi:tetratricopeptide (TPR) repeat protein